MNFFPLDLRKGIVAEVYQKLSSHMVDFHMVPEHQWLIHVSAPLTFSTWSSYCKEWGTRNEVLIEHLGEVMH